MRLLGVINRVSLAMVDHIGHQVPVGHAVASQFVCHDGLGLATLTPCKMLEEALRHRASSD